MLGTMKLLSVALLVSGGVSARASYQSKRAEGCCFQLDSVGFVNETVLEDHTGHIVLGGVFQQGAFCFEATNNTIKDTLGHNCFMRGPDYEFQCYQGAVGSTSFDLSTLDDGETTKLEYDSGPGSFLACPVGNTGQVYNVYSTSKEDKTGCLEVALILANQTSECAVAGNGIAATASSVATSTTATEIPAASAPALSSAASTPSSSASPSATSQTCSVASSAPSIAPRKLGSPDETGTSGIQDTSDNASVTPLNSTIFQFSVPQSFATSDQQLCALQFRMPFCSDLPAGYPCFSFSGTEQEVGADSGMIWSLLDDSGNMEWDSNALKQIFPGDNVVFGTFECGTASAADSDRKISWLASSVKDFALLFQQAGVGESPKFEDGVGVWVVPCS